MSVISAEVFTKAISDALHERACEAANVREFKWKLAEATGAEFRSVERWINGDSEPDAHHVWGLIDVLGPSFANKVLAIIGCTLARDEDLEAAQAVFGANSLAEIRNRLIVVEGAVADIRERVGRGEPRAVGEAG